MNTARSHHLQHLIAIVGIALSTACTETEPLAHGRGSTGARAATLVPLAAAAPVLGSCDRLRAPEGSTFAYHAFAVGVQIYRWNGTSWAFVGPRADLYADAGGQGFIGTHYAGPYWESLGGSKVKGALVDRCPAPDADAIDWLALAGTPEGGPGPFRHVTFIQRVNTVGGKAPSSGGTLGEVREVPYTAEYYFYRANGAI